MLTIMMDFAFFPLTAPTLIIRNPACITAEVTRAWAAVQYSSADPSVVCGQAAADPVRLYPIISGRSNDTDSFMQLDLRTKPWDGAETTPATGLAAWRPLRKKLTEHAGPKGD